MLRKEAVVIGMPIHINIEFEHCDDVGIVRQGNARQEHVCTGPRVIEHVLLGKEFEIEFVTTAKFQNVRLPGPPWLLNWVGGVKAQNGELQNMPEEIVAILLFAVHGQYLCLSLQVCGREQARENFHESRGAVRVAVGPETRNKESFEIELETDSIERHKGDEIYRREFLQLVVESQRLSGREGVQSGKDEEAAFKDPFDGGTV